MLIKEIESFIKSYYNLLIIVTLDVVLIIVPFLFSNNLEGFDSVGHLANAYYIKEAFWPWPDGWNMMTLSGYPQGLFYPSLFHWLAAALSFIMPLALAFKLLIVSAALAFPIVVFLLAKKLFNSDKIACFATTIVSIFYFFEIAISGNLFSDLFYGMFSHLFSLTILLLYLYFLFNSLNNKKHWRAAGIFLGLTLLSHIITGVVAFLFAIILIILSKNDFVRLKSLLKHLLIGALISACWWLPFLINVSYTSGSNASRVSEPIVLLLIPFIIILNIFTFRKKTEPALFFKAISVLSTLIFIGCLLGNSLNIDSLAIHSARFVIYPILLAPLSLTYLIFQSKINWKSLNLGVIACFFFYVFFFRIIPVGPFATDIIDKVENSWQEGRAIVIGNSSYLDARFHSTRMKLAMEHNMPIFEGLFVESSANGWYIMSLLNSWDSYRQNFVWAYTNLQDVDNIAWGAEIFGINYEYRLSDKSPKEDKISLIESREKQLVSRSASSTKNAYSKEASNLYFKIQKEDVANNTRIMEIMGESRPGLYFQTLYKINNTGLAEALSVAPINIENNWDDNVKKWWTTDWLKATSTSFYDYSKPILVYGAEPSEWELAPRNKNLDLVSVGKRMDTFVVDASVINRAAPIYVKVGYFPFWKAYDQFGHELKIYKSSPNFMLVYGRGIITFKYQKPWYYYGAYIVSGLAILFLTISYFTQKNKPLRKQKKSLK